MNSGDLIQSRYRLLRLIASGETASMWSAGDELIGRDVALKVYWEGKKVIDGKDGTFPAPGKVGVWTKADSVTYFDDLEVAPL